MEKALILSCSSDLGNCCKNEVVSSYLGTATSILTIIQIIVPILLLVMLTLNLTQLMMNPEDKKKISAIKNKFIAAILVFMIPVLMNATIGLLGDSDNSSFNFIACLKESKNIKLGNSTYKEITEEESKKMISSPEEYEKGKEKESNATTTGPTDSPLSTTCTVADSNVKLVPNDSNKTANIVGKANGLEVAAYAKSWIGKMSYNFSAQEELRVGGTCSCSHFVYQVLKHFGIMDHWGRSTVWGSCNVKGTTLYTDKYKLVPGDVLFWDFGNAVGHVEIYIGNGQSVGCNAGKGVTLATPTKYTTAIHLSAYD